MWRCIRVGRSPMVRIREMRLGCGARRWNWEGGLRGSGRGRKLGPRTVCYEWRCEGGMEDGCVDVWIVRSGGVGCCWLWDGISSGTKAGTGRCQFLSVETTVACGIGGSDIGLCLLSGFRIPVECVAVYVSVCCETRLSGRLRLVHDGL